MAISPLSPYINILQASQRSLGQFGLGQITANPSTPDASAQLTRVVTNSKLEGFLLISGVWALEGSFFMLRATTHLAKCGLLQGFASHIWLVTDISAFDGRLLEAGWLAQISAVLIIK